MASAAQPVTLAYQNDQFRQHNSSGAHPGTVRGENAPVLWAEIAVLLVKDAIDPVPPDKILQALLHCTKERRWVVQGPCTSFHYHPETHFFHLFNIMIGSR